MLAAVVTAYKPDAGFANRFRRLLSVCGAVLVVDNTPGGHAGFDLPAGFVLLQNRENAGLARALNAGIDKAMAIGAQRIVLFDQDSTPSPALINSLSEALDQAVRQMGERCCVGPKHLDDSIAVTTREVNAGGHVPGDPYTLSEVTCLPTSGMMFAPRVLQPDDRFSSALFLDLVDFEWCWRLRTKRWTFLRATDIFMYHRLGLAQRRFLGVTYHVPAPYRHYFQVRDTLRLAGRRYVPLYSKLRLLAVLPVKALVYPLLLDHGGERLRWMWQGLLDCLRSVEGIGAAEKRLSR